MSDGADMTAAASDPKNTSTLPSTTVPSSKGSELLQQPNNPPQQNGSMHAKVSPGSGGHLSNDGSQPANNDTNNVTAPAAGTTSQPEGPLLGSRADPEIGLIAVSSASSLNNSSSDVGNNRTLYLGNLHPFVTEATLQEVFAGLEGITELKVIKDKATGVSAGYGFAKFTETQYAQVALDRVSKCVLFGQEMRVNWAFQKELQEEVANHIHIFVGDLSADVTDATLLAAFQHLAGCSDARVMWDHATGRSRGYGFVSFRTTAEADAAIKAMHGQFVGARRIRCGWAQHKTDFAAPADPSILDRSDPTNTNVYIGNLSPGLTDAEARRHFGVYGPIAEVKLYRKGAYGFVRFKNHDDAVRAIVGLNGQMLMGKQLKCSWGRHPNMPPSGVQNSLMLAAAAGIPPLNLAQAQGMMGPGMNHGMHAPMGMVSGGILGMPLTSAGAQNMMQGQGAMLQGHHNDHHSGMQQGGMVGMDPNQLYGVQYGGMQQVFFSGQQQVQ